VLAMCTINAAKALKLESTLGSLEANKQADFVVYEADSFDEIIAGLDNPTITDVYWKGMKVC
ncbi:MAG: amidohydrolase family protein, partial [Erysipelotrichales bacterium]|nr:amidohydrolase family protein [Erysipelotrichales bacterium]